MRIEMPTLKLLLLYLACMAAAGATFAAYSSDVGVAPAISVAASSTPSSNLFFLAYFIVSVTVTVLLLRFTKLGKRLFTNAFPILFAFMLFAALYNIEAIWAVFLFPNAADASFYAVFLSTLGLLYLLYFRFRQRFFNLFSLLIASFFAFSLGVFLIPLFAVLLLLAASIYDLAAVLWLKTMQGLAKIGVERQLPMYLLIGSPAEIGQRLEGAQQAEYHSLLLGLGDIVLPVAALISFAPHLSYLAIAFSGAGLLVALLLNFRIARSRRMAVPALPLLTLFLFLFMGIGVLL